MIHHITAYIAATAFLLLVAAATSETEVAARKLYEVLPITESPTGFAEDTGYAARGPTWSPTGFVEEWRPSEPSSAPTQSIQNAPRVPGQLTITESPTGFAEDTGYANPSPIMSPTGSAEELRPSEPITTVGRSIYGGVPEKFPMTEAPTILADDSDYTLYQSTTATTGPVEDDFGFTPDPTTAPTTAPTQGIAESPKVPPPLCPKDIRLFHHNGETDFPVDKAVQIVSQDTSTVTVKLNQAWTSETATRTNIDHIFASYQASVFSKRCHEFKNVQSGTDFEQELTLTCNILSPVTTLRICVADDISKGVLGAADDAAVPKCCHPSLPKDTPVVCYDLQINCETKCIDETLQRKLFPANKPMLRSRRSKNNY